MHEFIKFAFKHPFFGLGMICCFNGFYDESTVDPVTGRVMRDESQGKVTTIFMYFKQIWVKIRENRQNFESIPNRGILGKGITRLIDLSKNYLYLFLLKGVFLHLILWPVAILICSIISLVIGLTGIVWALLITVLQLLCTWLIYDFET